MGAGSLLTISGNSLNRGSLYQGLSVVFEKKTFEKSMQGHLSTSMHFLVAKILKIDRYVYHCHNIGIG